MFSVTEHTPGFVSRLFSRPGSLRNSSQLEAALEVGRSSAGASADAYPAWPNLAAMMLSRAQEWDPRPMLRSDGPAGWRTLHWGEFGGRTARLARGLRGFGLQPGDRVLLCSENRPEVLIAEVALMALGAVPVPAYVTNLPEDHAHILRDCAPSLAIVAGAGLAERVAAGAAIAGRSLPILTMDADFAALEAEAAEPRALLRDAERISSGHLACLIYTSGTNGQPRGVMLPHRAILSNLRGAAGLVRRLGFKDELYLSFLPISHAFEHTVGGFLMPSLGVEVAFGGGAERLASDLAAVQPTIMTAVPRVLEAVRGRILTALAQAPGWRRRLFQQALEAGLRRLDGRSRVADRLLDPAYGRLVRRAVRARFGGRLWAVMSGGARLEPEVERFFQALGLLVMQGYGQTEAGPVIAANVPGAMRTGTVGKPLEGVALRLAADGEILVRGDLVMAGYWGQAEATAAVVRDGWLHTGDVGQLDGDGFLTITDRKRDLIVLAGGETVSPARIEGVLCAEAAIEQAVVAGDGQRGVHALLVAAADADDAAISAAVRHANTRLAPFERVRRHRTVPRFTLENGLLTPSHKVRRALVLDRFQGRAMEP